MNLQIITAGYRGLICIFCYIYRLEAQLEASKRREGVFTLSLNKNK